MSYCLAGRRRDMQGYVQVMKCNELDKNSLRRLSCFWSQHPMFCACTRPTLKISDILLLLSHLIRNADLIWKARGTCLNSGPAFPEWFQFDYDQRNENNSCWFRNTRHQENVFDFSTVSLVLVCCKNMPDIIRPIPANLGQISKSQSQARDTDIHPPID